MSNALDCRRSQSAATGDKYNSQLFIDRYLGQYSRNHEKRGFLERMILEEQKEGVVQRMHPSGDAEAADKV